jgi:hypothetical protein
MKPVVRWRQESRFGVTAWRANGQLIRVRRRSRSCKPETEERRIMSILGIRASRKQAADGRRGNA